MNRPDLTEAQEAQARAARRQHDAYMTTQPKNTYHPESYDQTVELGAKLLGESTIYPPKGGFGVVI